MPNNERLLGLWQLCRTSYLRHQNRAIDFPKGTDPTKTYQWRYLQALDRAITEFGLDEGITAKFIDIIAKYGHSRRLEAKGLAIFLQRNVLEICYEQLKKEHDSIEQTISIISMAHQFLTKKTGQSPKHLTLLRKENLGGYCNLISWYQAMSLPEAYIALSKPCGLALMTLEKQQPRDRQLIPSATKLYLTRHRLCSQPGLIEATTNIMQNEASIIGG